MGCKIIQLTETSTAIICCAKDNCEHDDNGPELAFDDNGNYYDVKDRPTDEESYTEWMKEKEICGGCVSCSKCGKPFTPYLY